MQDPLVNYQAGPFGSPFSIQSLLADSIVAANLPYEGLWVPVKWAKSATIELTGSISTLSVDIWGTNQQQPVNTYTVTIGGSQTNNDTLSLTFTNPLLPGGSETVSFQTTGGQTINQIAASLGAAVAADANLAVLGFQASVNAAVITITWPSLPYATPAVSASSPPIGSTTILSKAVTGAATETITVTNGTDGTNLTPSHLTALGLTSLTPMPVLWAKARVTTLTGGGAVVSAALAATN